MYSYYTHITNIFEMSTNRRLRKSKVDDLLESLSVGDSVLTTNPIGYVRNRQSLFHGKYPKRHVALNKVFENGEIKYYANRIN